MLSGIVILVVGLLCILGIGLASADDPDANGDFESSVYQCDTGPDAMSDVFGKDIPRTCIQVPNADWLSKTIERCYFTYVPESCQAANDPLKLPLVFDIHGLTSCPMYSARYTGWMEKAEEECLVVVWPIGNVNDNYATQGCWNLPGFLEGDGDVMTSPCCCFEFPDMSTSKYPDDQLFLRMAIDSVVESFDAKPEKTIAIDKSRVYMAGHSNGCMTSLAMAATHSDVVAAVCCHAGALITPFPQNYSPVPIWMAHGVKDEIIPFEGEVALDLGLLGKLGFWSFEDTMNYIADLNGCEEEMVETTNLGEIGTAYKRTNCTNSADVESVILYNSGHNPYLPPTNSSFAEELDAAVDTTAMAWEFCSSYSNPHQEQILLGEQDENEQKDPEADSYSNPHQEQILLGEQDENEQKDPEADGENLSTPSSASLSRLTHNVPALQGMIVLGAGFVFSYY